MPIYMQIEGIQGDVTAKGHENWIELDTLAFGTSRDIKSRTGKTSDREATLPNVGEIVINLPMSKSSPTIFTEACVGKAKHVKIDICQTGTDTAKPYLQYTLKDVLFSNYQVFIDHNQEHAVPKETLNLNFTQIEMKYTPFGSNNLGLAPSAAGYDLVTGTKV